MVKGTEKRLIKTLEFLKEPQGSTISTIVKVMNGDGPQVSLKKIVQTLRGCLENGILKVSDGRVKLNNIDVFSDGKTKEEKQMMDTKSRAKNQSIRQSLNPAKCGPKKTTKPKCPKVFSKADAMDDDAGGEGGEEGGEGEGGEGGTPEAQQKCPECPKCPKCPKCKKKKKRAKCPKPKPKCPKPKPKCPKPKPKCSKPKKPKKKPKKKCPQKKKPIKIMPYCKKKKPKCAKPTY